MRTLLGFLERSKNVDAEHIREELGTLHDFPTIQKRYHFLDQRFRRFALSSYSGCAALNEKY